MQNSFLIGFYLSLFSIPALAQIETYNSRFLKSKCSGAVFGGQRVEMRYGQFPSEETILINTSFYYAHDSAGSAKCKNDAANINLRIRALDTDRGGVMISLNYGLLKYRSGWSQDTIGKAITLQE